MKSIINDLRTARVAVSKSIDTPVKIAYALLRMSGGYKPTKSARRKVALKKSEITQVVENHLREREIAPVDVDWGKLFFTVVNNLSARNNLGDDAREALLSGVVQNLLLGMNLDTGNSYGKGDLANRIRILREEEDKPDSEIVRILASVIQNTTLTKIKYDRRSEYSGYENRPQEDGEGEKIDLFDQVLSLNPLSRQEAQQWMSLSQKDSTLRNLLKRIDKIIEQKADAGEALVYRAMRENPDYPSISQLKREPVTFQHPDAGVPITMSLSEAVALLKRAGLSSTDNVRYIVDKKLAPMLTRIKPVVLEALAMRERA